MIDFTPTGRLCLKKLKQGKTWFAIINLKKDENGNYNQRFINTHLLERGNKKNAEKILQEELDKYKQELEEQERKRLSRIRIDKNILFVDYLDEFIDDKKADIKPTTYATDKYNIKQIREYFDLINYKPLLRDITAQDIDKFYAYRRNEKNNKIITVEHFKNIIKPALKQAFIYDLIPSNPYDKVKAFPKKVKKAQTPKSVCLSENDIRLFIEKAKTHKLGDIFTLALLLGTRRSELLGLKWSNVNFDKGILTISGNVQKYEGKLVNFEFNKTEESEDDVLMSNLVMALLKKIKEKQKNNKILFGNSYNTQYLDYVCVNEMGVLYNPDFLTKQIKKFFISNGMDERLHLHSLRHSYGTYIYSKTRDLENARIGLRHTDIKTTQIYLHPEKTAKVEIANTIDQIMNVEDLISPATNENKEDK